MPVVLHAPFYHGRGKRPSFYSLFKNTVFQIIKQYVQNFEKKTKQKPPYMYKDVEKNLENYTLEFNSG